VAECDITLDTSFPKDIRNCEAIKQNHELDMSRLATLHSLINIAECIGVADGIKPLNHNRKMLEKANH